MATAFDTDAFERATDPVLRVLSAEQARTLVQYRADDALQHRIEELAEKNSEGELNEDELAEYEAYVRANKFVAILQAQARRMLAQS